MSAMDVDGFVRVAGCEVAGVTVEKFRSSKTGLVVCLAQVEGPIVEGFFCLGECTLCSYIIFSISMLYWTAQVIRIVEIMCCCV